MTATGAEIAGGDAIPMDVLAADGEGDIDRDGGEKEGDGTATRADMEGGNVLAMDAEAGGEVD